ncbi:ankyrin [Nemania sp. FL0031]|nr:ankyrin [Nemania sp. FL0031]
MPSNSIIRKRNGSVLDGYEERIKELYNCSTLAQLKATIDEEAKQEIPVSQYRGKITQLGLRKYRVASETEKLASILARRPAGSKVFLRGKQLSQDEVRRIQSRSRPDIFKQLNPGQPPKDYTIRSPTPEQAENYAANIPFMEFEKALNWLFGGSRYHQHLRGNIGIAPQLLRDQRNPPASHLAMVETWDPVTLDLNNPHALARLGAIMPPIDFPSRHDVNIANLSLRRQFLFSIANNFAGIDGLPSWRQLDLLRDVSSEMIYQLFQLTKGPTARSIAQSLFRASIESGNHTIIHALLSVEPAGIDVNKEKIVIGASTYTPVGRASFLRRRETIRVLIQHGADVNMAYPEEAKGWAPKEYNAALSYAVRSTSRTDTHRGSPLDIETFKLLSNATRVIPNNVIRSLINTREEDLLLYLMQEQFEKFEKKFEFPLSYLSYEFVHKYMVMVLKTLSEENALTIIPALIHIMGRPGLLDAAAYRGYLVLADTLVSNFDFYPDGPTLLLAFSGGHESIVRKFLPLASPSIHVDYDFFTPLSSAIMVGDRDLINFVRDSGAFEYLDSKSAFELAWNAAVRQDNTEVIDELLQLRHDPPGSYPLYLLRVALREDNYQSAEELLARGAIGPYKAIWPTWDGSLNPKGEAWKQFRRRFKDLGLELHISRGRLEIHEFREFGGYLEHVEPLEPIESVRSPELFELLLDFSLDVVPCLADVFRIATSRTDYSLVHRALAEGGWSPDNDRLSNYALRIALEQRDKKLIDIIIEAGASVNLREERPILGSRWPRDSVLVKAATMGDDDLTKHLLRRGADPNDSYALETAFRTNQAVFETILTTYKKTHEFSMNSFGSRLLISAVKDKDTALIEKLLENNADPHGFDINELDRQVTPFGHAIEMDDGCNFTMVTQFLNHRCCASDVVSRLRWRTIGSSMGTSLRSEQIPGNLGPRTTAFLAAIATGNVELVELLVRSNEGIVHAPARGGIKRTALQRAAEIGSLKMVKFIHNLGADINEPPNRLGGATALQLAAAGGFGQIVCYLIDHGADINAPAALRDGMTALVGAAAKGRIDIVAILLNKGAACGEGGAEQFELAMKKAEHYGYYATADYLKERWDAQQQGALQLPDPMDEFIVDLSDEG